MSLRLHSLTTQLKQPRNIALAADMRQQRRRANSSVPLMHYRQPPAIHRNNITCSRLNLHKHLTTCLSHRAANTDQPSATTFIYRPMPSDTIQHHSHQTTRCLTIILLYLSDSFDGTAFECLCTLYLNACLLVLSLSGSFVNKNAIKHKIKVSVLFCRPCLRFWRIL